MPTDTLDGILARVRSWPQPLQDDALAVLLALEAEGGSPYILTEDEHRDIVRALEEVERGEIATDEEVSSVFRRYRE